MSQFDNYEKQEKTPPKECMFFIDKENPNIINVRFGKYKEITLPNRYQYEEGQKIRLVDIEPTAFQECDFDVNGVSEGIVTCIREDGLIEIPNKVFFHHGNVKVFVKHVDEDDITIIKVINFVISDRLRPSPYIEPEEEQSFREWVQEKLDKGTIKSIEETVMSEEDAGINEITVTMNDNVTKFTFYVRNGHGIIGGGETGQVLVKKSDEDFDTEWIDIPPTVNVVQETGESTEDVMSQNAVTAGLNLKANASDLPTEVQLVPEIESGDAGKVLAVNQTEDGTEWVTVQSGTDLPVIVAGDAGKVLTVNQSEDGMEWAEASLNSLRIIYNETTYDEIYDAIHNLHDKLKFVTIQFNDLTTSCHTYPVTEIYVYESYGIPIYVGYWDYGAKYEISIRKEEESTIYSAMQRGRTLITPDIEQGVGKILSWTGYDTTWIDVPKELPNVDVSDDGKILQVVNGAWDKVVQNENGNKTWFGSGAPSSSIASERGDIYIDTANNNKEYICTQYIDPSNVTELTNLDVVLNSTGNYPESGIVDCSFGSVGGIETKSQGIRTVNIEVDGNRIVARFQQYSGYYNDTLIDGSGETKTGLTIGSNVAKRPIHITFNENARNITNSELIKWFVDNANTISGTGSIWVEASANPLGIPSANGQTNGKILKVNNNAWVVSNETQELPSVTMSDEGKVLTVNDSGNWVASEVSNSGIQYFSGSGAPVSSIVANVGDLYRDTLTNYLYQCTQYLDPSSVTDLTGYTFTFKDNIYTEIEQVQGHGTVSPPSSKFSLNFTSGGTSNVYIEAFKHQYNLQHFLIYYASNGAPTYALNYDEWTNEVNKTISITGGADATNPDLISFILTASGAGGSSWVRIECEDELPQVTPEDEGKVLTVSGTGEWIPSEISNDAVQELEGSGEPVSSIVAKKGDLYRDINTNKVYICTQYINPSEIETLLNTTITFNDVIPLDQFNTTGTYRINFGNESGSSTGIAVNKDSNGGSLRTQSGTGASGFNFCNIYETRSGWEYPVVKTVTITGGNDVTNANLISFLTRNASISGTGSQWTLVGPTDDELPTVSSVDAGKVLQVSDQGEWEVNSIDINGVVAYYGTTDPTSSLVANTGDIYINRATNKVFVCKQYNSMDNVTDLSGLTVHFKDATSQNVPFAYGLYTYGQQGHGSTFYINFTCDNVDYTYMYINGGYTYLQYYNSSAHVDAARFMGYPVLWYDSKYQTVTFTGGTEATNPTFIDIVINNSDNISGLGSIWVEVNPDELPSVTGSDVGKVLQVNNLGSWVAGPVPFEGATSYRGSGAPVSSIPANVGDLYMDTTNNKLYECTAYVDPTLTTKLDGLKITLKTTGNFPTDGMTNYQFDKGGVTAFGYTNNNTNNQLRGITVTGNKIQVSVWDYGTSTYTLIDGSGTQKENLPIYTGGMLGNPARIAFNNDINLDNQELVNWFIENASDIEGLGSKWVEVVAKDTRLPEVSSTNNGKILKVSSGAWSIQSETTELPSVSSTDNGKLLGVSNGAWAKVLAPTELPSVTSSDEGKVLQVNSSGQWATTNAFEEEVLTFTLADNTTVTKTFLVKVVNS